MPRIRILVNSINKLKSKQQKQLITHPRAVCFALPNVFNFYKVGGSLRYDDPTYIIRKADRDLYCALKAKEFCYVLNSRQMGKSSLRVRMMKTLKKEGFKCVAIDIGILGKFATAEQWYGGLVAELWRKLRLSRGIDEDLAWWRSHLELSPVQRLSRFIEDVLLVNCNADIIVFLDEIDNIINLDFRDEFLILIRNCYERRVEIKDYNRLTFCLLGVATPSNLRIDKQISPFNIGKAIHLTGFTIEEAQPLLSGLKDRFDRPEKVLQSILTRTKGQPFLTQKLCSLVVKYSDTENFNLSQLIQQYIIDNWEIQDEPEHLKTIRDRILVGSQNKAIILRIYQRILQEQGIKADSSEEQVALRLSGLVSKRKGQLEVSNPIYRQVFNSQWVSKQLAGISPYQNALSDWIKSECQDSSRLLRGTTLAEGQIWAKRHNITSIERDFLQASELLEIETKQQAQLARQTELVRSQLIQKKRLLRWQRLFIGFSLVMVAAFYLKSRQTYLGNINTLVRSSEALFASNQKLDALLAAIEAQEKLNKALKSNQNLTVQIDAALKQAVYTIKEKNRLLGHQDRLYGIALSPDGKLLATSATDNTIRLWKKEPLGWQSDRILKDHNGWVVDLAIHPHKNTLVSVSRDRTAKLWDRDGNLLATLKHQHPLTSVAIADELIYIGTETGTIHIWQEQKLIQTIDAHQNSVNAITITPDGHLITAGEDKTLKIWQQGKLIQTLKGHTEGVRAVAITDDGNQIVSASRDKTLKIWNRQGTEIATLKGHTAPVYGVALNPANNRIVSVSGDKTLKIWNLQGTEITTLKGHTNRVWDAVYLDNKTIASASWDKTVRIWQPDNNLIKILSDHQDVAIALDYKQNLIASASDDTTVKLWNQNGTLFKTFTQHTAEVYDVAISDRFIASVGADKTLKIWHRDKVTSIQAHDAAIWAVKIDRNDRKIITAGDDNLIKIWNDRGKAIATLKGHNQKIWDLTITPNNKFLISASEDNTIKIWTLEGSLLKTLTGHQDAIRTVTTNNKQIISAGEDRTIKIWDFQGNLITTLKKHNATIKGLALSPDGQYLVSVDDGGQIVIWQQTPLTSPKSQQKNNSNPNLWTYKQTILGHNNSIWSVAFSSDSETLATAGEDHKIILWNFQRILQLDTLQYACDWAKDYLQNNPEITKRNLCD